MQSARLSALRLLVLASAAAMLLSLSLVAPAAPAKPPTIFINGTSYLDYGFHPRKLEVRRRATVHWSWDSNAAHNVTFRKLGKASVTGASEKFKLTFKRRGTYRYLCTVHGFRGKIVVK